MWISSAVSDLTTRTTRSPLLTSIFWMPPTGLAFLTVTVWTGGPAGAVVVVVVPVAVVVVLVLVIVPVSSGVVAVAPVVLSSSPPLLAITKPPTATTMTAATTAMRPWFDMGPPFSNRCGRARRPLITRRRRAAARVRQR